MSTAFTFRVLEYEFGWTELMSSIWDEFAIIGIYTDWEPLLCASYHIVFLPITYQPVSLSNYMSISAIITFTSAPLVYGRCQAQSKSSTLNHWAVAVRFWAQRKVWAEDVSRGSQCGRWDSVRESSYLPGPVKLTLLQSLSLFYVAGERFMP